jgi:zinc D-Ala-D-Ala dipeptidase
MKLRIVIGLLSIIFISNAETTFADSISDISRNPNFVNISQFENVVTDLKYATTHNFMGQNMYGNFKTAYLNKIAAIKFKKAIEILKQQKPGWKFLVFDAFRPRRIQRKFWDKVKNTPQEPYVADPVTGSVHNFGFAIDLSLKDQKGSELDMGTPFDSFEKKAEPQLELKFLNSGELTKVQVSNREILRNVMTQAGFIQLPNEWWHYDALPGDLVKKTYKIVE